MPASITAWTWAGASTGAIGEAVRGQRRLGRVGGQAAGGELAADLGVGDRLGELTRLRADADSGRGPGLEEPCEPEPPPAPATGSTAWGWACSAGVLGGPTRCGVGVRVEPLPLPAPRDQPGRDGAT